MRFTLKTAVGHVKELEETIADARSQVPALSVYMV